MPKSKLFLVYMLAMTMYVGTAYAGSPASGDKAADTSAKAPVVIEADELYFSDSTGDMFAKGNVVVTQDNAAVLGDLLRGNVKSNEVWIDGKCTFTEPDTKIAGTSSSYNYKTRTGTMAQAAGKVGQQIVTGQNIDIFPTKVVIHNGTLTRCPAKVPDYHVSADKVEIWPGDKLIAYNAKFWIKGAVIYSLPKYQQSLTPGSQSEFPQLNYTSQDGFSIKQHLEYPISEQVSFYAEPTWYSKSGYRPSFGVSDHSGGYTLGVVDGYFRDSNDNWIKKEPEYDLKFGHQVGSLPVNYSLSAIYGKWIGSDKASWHQDYSLYFSGVPIQMGNIFRLHLGTGVEKLMESFDGSSQNIFRYDASLSEHWSDRFSTYLGYHYTRNNQTLFAYGSTALARELDSGFTYKIDRMDSVGVAQSYDLNNKRVYDQDYYWYRDVHCWQLTVEYRAKRHQYVIDFTTERF